MTLGYVAILVGTGLALCSFPCTPGAALCSRISRGTSFGLDDFPGGPSRLSQCPLAPASGRRCSTGLGREYTLGRGTVNVSGFACWQVPDPMPSIGNG